MVNRRERRAADKQGKAAAPKPSLRTEAAWHQSQGRLDDAATLYTRALAREPADAEILNNLACILLAQGKRADAAQRFAQVLTLTPELFDRYADITAILGEVNPALDRAVTRAAQAWPALPPVLDLLAPDGLDAVANDPLLRCVLQNHAVRDLGLEWFLTALRRALLDAAGNAVAARDGAALLPLCCALAQQCFVNEYVFAVAANEWRQATRLKDALLASIATGAAVPPLWLAVVASYMPLGALPAAGLRDKRWPDKAETDAIGALLTQQIREPEAERRLRDSIPAMTAIADETSVRVRQQYEENPYPRWVLAPSRPTPSTVAAYLRKEFPDAPVRSRGDGAERILIAGCGTGLHALGMAQRFPRCRLTAIDLSLASLCYAKRKTAELGRGDIAYAQADILQLHTLQQRFDVIDASGVLHHLADPFDGWRNLLSLLEPGGLMRIGLYSEIARRDVVAARAFIAEHGYGATPDDIRRCRQDLLASPLHGIARYYDFFGTSECRDLLFHVQEHRLTIPHIDSFLHEHGLDFVGFELAPQVRGQYRLRFPDDKAMTDLGRWDAYERDNPATFASMYQFWIQRR